jgi:hypothetical protein
MMILAPRVAYHRSFPLLTRNVARAMSEARLTIISRNDGSGPADGARVDRRSPSKTGPVEPLDAEF